MTTRIISLISNTFDATNVYFGIRIRTDDTTITDEPTSTLAFNLNASAGSGCGFLGGSADGNFTVSNQAYTTVDGILQADVVLTIPQSMVIPAPYADLDAFHADFVRLSLDSVPGFNFLEFFPACFQKGTHILTPEGEKPVELLRQGDLVISAKTGKSVPIKAMCNFFGTQANCPLYCLPKDALGENKPKQDLFLSSRHRVSFDGQLRHMVCLAELGKSVPTGKARIEYYHIELADCFDTVIAEGVEVETFIDPRVVAHDWECTGACCTYIPIGPQPIMSTLVEPLTITA